MAISNPTQPYDMLYIYYVEGYFAAPTVRFSEAMVGNWEEDGFSFLFFSQPADEEVAHAISANPHVTLLDTYQMSYDDWQGAALQPFRVGNLAITPPWKTMLPQPADIPILLDPGVVFGSGTHATTRDCLESIVLACYKEQLASAIDIGTGSGLLAIAAAKLGCQQVVAVDLNRLAVKTARNNIVLNDLAHRVLAIQGDACSCMMRPADLLIANIHYDVMHKLIASDMFLRHKMFILSGLLRSQARLVEAQLARYPVTIIHTWQRDGIWHTYFGKVN